MAAEADTPKIVINRDEILTKHEAWTTGEASSSSDTGTRREAIGSYCEKNGIENKAFSQFRAGMKIKNDGKRRDWVRSMQLLLPVAERVVFGNQDEMELSDQDDGTTDEAEDADVHPAEVEAAETAEQEPDDHPAELADEEAAADNVKAFTG